MGKSAIEWTEQTWNPIVGCTIVSPGCTNCYAMKMAARIEAMGNQPRYVGTTKKVNGNAIWTGLLSRAPDSALLAPLKRKKPTTYFVNSMGDLFHEDCPDEWIDRVFAVMALSPQHTFQVLTKRAQRMREWFADVERADHVGLAMLTLVDRIPYGHRRVPWPLPNVWLGVSAERQQEADERIPLLLQTPAAVRFLSAEPLLGPVRLINIPVKIGPDRGEGDRGFGVRQLDWVIVGGESGPKARPMHPGWARDLRDGCAAAGVAFFFKQWGHWSPTHPDWPNCKSYAVADDGTVYVACDIAYPDGPRYGEAIRAGHDKAHLTSMYPLGKKAAGRHLDGALHDAMPAHSPKLESKTHGR